MAKGALGLDLDEPPAEIKDMGLNSPDSYILPRFNTWISSGMIVYPNGKSEEEQESWLVQDFQTLLWRYNWHVAKLRPKYGR